MSDLTERRGGLARLRLALAELESAELAEALADVDALALARASEARLPTIEDVASCSNRSAWLSCSTRAVPRACHGSRCPGCCDMHACVGAEPL